jgi:hypothetical protein
VYHFNDANACTFQRLQTHVFPFQEDVPFYKQGEEVYILGQQSPSHSPQPMAVCTIVDGEAYKIISDPNGKAMSMYFVACAYG